MTKLVVLFFHSRPGARSWGAVCLLRCLDSWAELRRRARIVDSNAIAARLQGPLFGVGLDALSLEAGEATRRDA